LVCYLVSCFSRENHSSFSLPPALLPPKKLFWSFTFQLLFFVQKWSSPIESGCRSIAFVSFILFYFIFRFGLLSGKFRDFHRFSFSEIACYFVCGFLTFFSLLVAVIDCNFLSSTLPYSNFLEKNFWGFVCVLECRRHARSAPSGRHTEIDGGENIFKNFDILKKMTSKRNFFKCVGNFSRPFACRNRSQNKNEHGREERPNEFVTA
jgi:hypothetical protein